MNTLLLQQIAEFIQKPPTQADEKQFNALALALFEYQYEESLPLRRLWQSLGIRPDTVERWQQITPVPVEAFKRLELSCAPAQAITTVFHSSGTTGMQTSRHFFDAEALSLYDISLRRGFDLALPQHPTLLWALMPPPEDAPHSSLSHMLGALKACRFFWNETAALADALNGLEAPICLFGTAFAFVQLFDQTDQQWALPEGSIVIETGGFKGRTREVPRVEFYGMLSERFGVSPASCFSEYGMCEMASQFYGYGLEPVKRGPHWVRSRTIDPETNKDTLPGQPGLLCHFDLANFNSTVVVQTQDMGTLTEDGFLLHGRASEAEVRGCSLLVEDSWISG